MKITRFRGSGVNGYLDFDLQFNDDLTFLTGINGTGKTSALNSIVSLLLPRLDYLAGDFFETISIEIDQDDKLVQLSATKHGPSTRIDCSLYPDDSLLLNEFEAPDTLPLHRHREIEAEYYKEFLLRNAKHPVVEFLEGLPTPMFLGLDRRSLSPDFETRRYARAPLHSQQKRRSIFARSLGQSLDESLWFAQEKYQSYLRQEARLDGKFRENLVVALIDFPPISFGGLLEDPSKDELMNIEKARKNLKRLPELLNVPTELISKNVDPMFEFLDKSLAVIRKPRSKSETDEHKFDARMEALIDWSYNKTQLDKINRLSDIVSEYNDASAEVFGKANEFLDTVNTFLADSGKTVRFDGFGRLKFFIYSEEEDRDIRTLSSGEIQLIVILTHLYFNPEVEKANVFIIDEPELSLHVQWQEKFVDSIVKASSETQFILATHSPSIILDRVLNCVEISSKKP
ncbi:AAA family ATPase [Falsihalocynthiibacter sp. S25ZX9]|uniref:AAA family ATPase n=1 Tax=Falsihalocynthiibacter sp. S25ZX9 TaxID=3240870 RepID=UPI003510AA23